MSRPPNHIRDDHQASHFEQPTSRAAWTLRLATPHSFARPDSSEHPLSSLRKKRRFGNPDQRRKAREGLGGTHRERDGDPVESQERVEQNGFSKDSDGRVRAWQPWYLPFP